MARHRIRPYWKDAPPAPRYLFTVVDRVEPKLYSGIPGSAYNLLEETNLDTGKKVILGRVLRRQGYAEQVLDLQELLKQVTGRAVYQRYQLR